MVKVIKPRADDKKVQTKKVPVKVEKKEPLDPRTESMRMLAKFYMGEMDLKMKEKQMLIAQGKEGPVWMAALELLKDRVIKTEDPDLRLKMYQAMVELLASLGQKEDLQVIQEIIARINLKGFKEMGFERVEIECDDGACPACRKMAGKKMTIEEATNTMPLPCKECSTKKDEVQGYCRCRYFAVF
ncbi:MAG: hypothetical protein LUQ09_03190 [Methanomassiliicoccales archaeon]|nr:hypothetical protein [Methanomassiliicoccales archaeon]